MHVNRSSASPQGVRVDWFDIQGTHLAQFQAAKLDLPQRS